MEFECKYCGRICKNKLSKSSHENKCKNNPNRRDMSGKNNPRYGKEPPNKRKKTDKYKLGKVILDKTIQEIEEYKEKQKCCEIRGKTYILCIDHNHKNNTFRGILCQSCNRALGWVEKHEESIKKYLAREDI